MADCSAMPHMRACNYTFHLDEFDAFMELAVCLSVISFSFPPEKAGLFVLCNALDPIPAQLNDRY